MKHFRILCVICVLLLGNVQNFFAQNISFQNINSAKVYLSSKGISEEEFLTALKAKGFDVNNTQVDYILQNKSLIQNVVQELELSKVSKGIEQKPVSGSISNENGTVQTAKMPSEVPTPTLEKDLRVAKTSVKDTAQTIDFPMTGIYGHDLFEKSKISNYLNLKDVSPPNSYVLGPGDKINVLIFGKSQADLLYEINIDGYIQPTSMPKLFLKGLTLQQAKAYLLNRFSSYYQFNSDQFALTIQSARQVTVNIFGEVNNSGIYSLSGLNTVLNAIAVAGGPNSLGSIRNIQLIRNGKTTTFDVYAFLENPSSQFDFFLQNNDVIYVPLSKKIIRLEGAVNRNLRFELNEKEGMNELIKYAGGLPSTTFTEIVQIVRIENNQTILNEYALNDLILTKKVHLQNGDIVRFKKLNSPIKDFVIASGAFYYPGQFDFDSTKTLKNLIKKARFLPEANLNYAFIYRDNFDNTKKAIPINLNSILNSDLDFQLIKGDEIFIFDKSQITDAFKISVSGEVRSPFSRSFRFDDTIFLENAIELAGGLKSGASNSAYVLRNNPFLPKKTTYIPLDLDNSKQFKMLPGDELIVLNKADYEFDKSIRIMGEVNAEYATRFDTSMSIRDLFILAKGKSLLADLNNVDLFRVVFNGNQISRVSIKLDLNDNYEVENLPNFSLEPFDIIVVRKIQNSRFQDLLTITGEVKFPGPYLIKKDKYFFSELIQDAGGFTQFSDINNIVLSRKGEGNIVFSALEAINNSGELFKDPILRPNDEITVGLINNTVKINLTGTKLFSDLQNSILITYHGKSTAKWYINNFAGGFEANADRNSLFVLSKSGKVTKTSKVFFIRKYPKLNPGDTIGLRLKVPKEEKSNNDKPFDWEKLTSKVISIFTALALIQAYVK
ncbi:SLBB domain-containing protein [Aquirufa sp. ROCK-SH2]